MMSAPLGWLKRSLYLCAPLILLVCFDLFFFGRYLLYGQTLSNLPIIADWDYFWNAGRTTSFFVYMYDPSLYWFSEPLRRLGRELMLTGQNPFWCANSGCGFPLFCDPESRLLSPITWLFPPTGLFYMASIIAKVVLAQYGTFKLARILGLGSYSGTFAAVVYSFCPFILWQSELSFESWQCPWIILTFILATRKLEPVRVVLLAFVCAFSVLTMHKECSFNAISAGVFFSLILSFLEHRFLIGVRIIGIAALLSVALAGPLLFSYIELILNSHCAIRNDLTVLPAVPVESIFACLFYPIAGPASSFLGFMSVILLIIPVWRPRRTVVCLLVSTVVSFVLCTLPWPVSALFLIRPLNYLEPLYFFQFLVLFLSLLTGCGFERVIAVGSRQLVCLAFAILLSGWIVYCLLSFAGIDISVCAWHGSMLPPQVVPHVARNNLLFSIGFAIECIVLGLIDVKQAIRKKVLCYSLIGLTFCSLWLVSRGSIPHQSKPFEYPTTDCTEFLRRSGSRIVGVGRRFFPANVPALYGIRDLRLGAQLEPSGLNEFLAACRSAMSEGFAFPFQDVVSSFVDLASVSLVVSRTPVVVDSELKQIASGANTTVSNLPYHCGAILAEYAVVHDARNRQVIGVTRWYAPSVDVQFYTVQAAVLRADGMLLWEGQEMRLSEFRRVGPRQLIEVPYLLPLPETSAKNGKLSLVVRLKNRLTGAAEWPTVVGKHVVGPQVQLCLKGILAAQITPFYSSMNLVFESQSGVRVYRNKNALSECYFVRNSYSCRDMSEAVSMLATSPSLARDRVMLVSANSAALEQSQVLRLIPPTVTDASSKFSYKALPLLRKSNVHLRAAFDAPSDGWVVVTDTYYPGWNAYLDNKQVTIHRANVLFRAVSVAKGPHILVYKYRPDSVLFGLILQFVALVACIVVLLRRQKI